VQPVHDVALVALLAVPTSQSVQEAAFVLLLYEPAVQAVQVRSEFAVPAMSTRCPGGQLEYAAQSLLVVVVPGVRRYWFELQSVCGVHVIEAFGAEVKVPASQASQIGCVVASPGVDTR
jgi:hypothetical protein